MTFDIVVIQPLVALIAGILILLIPPSEFGRRDLSDPDRPRRAVAALDIPRPPINMARRRFSPSLA
jgi:hypothetical protein